MKKSNKHTCSNWLRNGLKISLVLLAVLSIAACKEQIIHDLDETDANRFVTRLHEGNIESVKVKQPDGQWSISVGKSDTISALKYLNDARMFKNPQGAAQQKPSLVSSKEDQKFHYERAVSRELERTLSGMPDVLDARVHLNLPASDPIFGNRLPDSKGSGSVMLVVSESFDSNMAQVKELIAGASGIDKAAINILISREKPAESHFAKQPLPVIEKAAPTSFQFKAGHAYLLGAVALLIACAAAALIYKRQGKSLAVAVDDSAEKDLYELARNIN